VPERPVVYLKPWRWDHYAEVAAHLSAAAYCGKESYETREWTGRLKGFKVTKVISNYANDV
jgi:hypothetical protein